MAVRTVNLLQSILLILAGLTVLGMGIYLVKGGAEQFEPKVHYTVRFANSGGLGGGDDVYLDGQKVGDVVGTDRVEEERCVDVIVEIGKAVRIPAGSTAIVTRSVTGTAAIEIISGESSDDLAPGGEIEGQLPRSFDEIQDQVGEIGGDLQTIWRKLNAVIEDVTGVAGAFDAGEIRANWGAATAAFGRLGETWQRLLEEAEGPAGEVQDRFERGAADWRRLGGDLGRDWDEIGDKARTIRANYEEAARGMRDLRPDVDGIAAAYGDAVERFEAAAGKLRAVVHEVRETLVESKPEVKRLVADAEDAFDGFQTLQGDLLRAPWKLLYKPSPEEVEAVHRFNALRLYFEAAAEISRTIDGLDVLRRLGALNEPRHAELVGDVFRRLRRALDGFDAHQKRIVELLVEDGDLGAK